MRPCLQVRLATASLALPLCTVSGAQAALDLSPALDRGAEIAPILSGERVLATSSLRVFAFDACSGEWLWSTEPPAGWALLPARERGELFSALDPSELELAPAASGSVAVAALQLPRTRMKAVSWPGIDVIRPVPQRRLHAFDVATGRALWDHAPAPGWTGFDGTFAQRANVVGSPLLCGELVLVPCTTDESSIDYRVACYALASGQLLWQTFVLRGQVTCTGMGWLNHGFVAAPLVLARERGLVLAATGLGQLAALDPATGILMWSGAYPAVPLPRTHSYLPPERKGVWRTSAPVVAADVVLVAPHDSDALSAFDLGDGTLLWSVRAEQLAELAHVSGRFDQLIGASADTVYLGGTAIAAFVKPAGLRSVAGFTPLWSAEIDPHSASPVRARWTGATLIVPRAWDALAFDTRTGERRALAKIVNPAGLLLADEAAFVLDGRGLRRIALP